MSVTVRPIGPPMSWVLESGMIPLRLANPCVPRIPTRLLWDAGMRIEPQVSLPIPTAAKLAAIAAPVPPLEPLTCRVALFLDRCKLLKYRHFAPGARGVFRDLHAIA